MEGAPFKIYEAVTTATLYDTKIEGFEWHCGMNY